MNSIEKTRRTKSLDIGDPMPGLDPPGSLGSKKKKELSQTVARLREEANLRGKALYRVLGKLGVQGDNLTHAQEQIAEAQRQAMTYHVLYDKEVARRKRADERADALYSAVIGAQAALDTAGALSESRLEVEKLQVLSGNVRPIGDTNQKEVRS